MSTGLAPAAAAPQRAPVYQPLKNSPPNVGWRLEQMLTEGRRITARERYRQQRNREAYRGNTYLMPLSVARGSGQLQRLAPADMLPSGRRRDTVNKLRQMVDGRVGMLAGQKPQHEAVAATRSSADRDAARVATRFVDFQWDNPDGWDIASYLRQLVLWAEQDGIAFGCVLFDRSRGGMVSEMWAPDPTTGQPAPVTDQQRIAALMEEDPDGSTLWHSRAYTRGEVVLRPVRMGALAIDPNMTTDWRQCGYVIESRRRRLADIERELGYPITDIIKQSDAAMGKRQGTTRPSGGTISPEDGSGEQRIDPAREVFVHELFAEATGPTGEWPQGAHVMWVQDAPGAPLVQEPWMWPDGSPRCLPYRPLVPRPDGGHLLKTLGTVDELLPIQRQYDRRWSQYGEWLDLAARPPLLMVGGSLRSRTVYNADRIVHVNPGFEPPRFMTVPPDPGLALLSSINTLENAMGDIAMQSGPVRGEDVPGIQAAAAYQSLIQQGEQQLGGTEAEVKTHAQWAIGEALKNVQWFYTVERTVNMPGVDDEAAFVNFTGAKIRGATTWRITSSLLPRNKAWQNAQLLQFMQYAGPRFDPTPYAPQILEGDVDAIITMEQIQARKQQAENIDLAGIAEIPGANRLWQVFVQMRDTYAQTFMGLSQTMRDSAMATGTTPPLNPQQVMQQMGAPPPPKVLDMLRTAGFPVPSVSISDRDAIHIRELEFFMTEDAFRSHPPIVQQAAREHLNEHLEQQAQRTAAMAAQIPQQMIGAPAGAQPAGAPSAPPPPDGGQ